jgi:hypothetical protein
MNDPTDAIYSALFTALNGNLSYGGVSWPVYTGVPGSASISNYVHISSLSCVDAGAKIEKIWDCSLSIEIIGSSKSVMTRKPVNYISNLIIGLLAYKSLSMTGFNQVVQPYIEGFETFDTTTEAEILNVKQLFFRFSVQEN